MSQQHVEPMEAEELAHHPSPKQYVWVAIILAIVTAAEVAIYYIGFFEEHTGALIAFLIAFALMKFVMVAAWFMHLRFDSNLFTRMFVSGLFLAIGVYMAALATFRFFT